MEHDSQPEAYYMESAKKSGVGGIRVVSKLQIPPRADERGEELR